MSTSSRIGSLSIITDTLRDVSLSQNKLGELQNQISSGYKSRDFEGLDGSVEQFTQITAQLGRTQQYSTSNKGNIAKLQTADAVIGQIIDIADQMKNIMVGANGAIIQTGNIPQVMNDLLTSLANQLNGTFNGNYLFGGTDTANPPIPSTSVANVTLGVPDDSYYAGAKQDGIMRADDRTDITFPVRADDVAFQKIYAAAKQAVTAAQNSDSVMMQSAQQLIQSAQGDLIAARSRVGSAVVNIQANDDRLTAVAGYLKELSDNVSKTDLVAASTEVSGYQAILQASFQVYARLSQLRLSDYLK